MDSLPSLSLKNQVSQAEWQVRVDLAACYRIVADLGWDDLIYTHISAKVPDQDAYLVNAFGLTFDEITASNLVKVNLKGEVLDDTPFHINPAGFTIHSCIHEVRKDAHCIIHLHTNETVAVASQTHGLQPLCQHALFSLRSLSYHEYEGLAVNDDERARLQKDLGDSDHLLLVNHGGLTVGPTIGDAFMRFYDMQRACEIQLMLQASGQPVTPISDDIVNQIKQQASVVHSGATGGQLNWPAMIRKAYRLDPNFAT